MMDISVSIQKDCSVCFEPLDESEFIKLECGHEFCQSCLISQFRVCFATQKLDLIPCLQQDCAARISKRQLQKILPEDEYLRFRHLLQKKQYNLSDCPKCGKLQKREVEPILECPCGHKFCAFHSDAHPLSMSCDEYERILTEREDIILSKKKMEEIKTCPGCNNPVEKGGGCDHIKCIWCGTKFCYNCRGTVWKGSKEAPTCAGCGQGFLDHDYFWKWQLLSVLLAPIWVPLFLLNICCTTLCCVFCCWPKRLGATEKRKDSSGCERIGIICSCQCAPILLCLVVWGCGPWHDLDEPPDEIEEVMSIIV